MALCGECDFCGVDPSLVEKRGRLAAYREVLEMVQRKPQDLYAPGEPRVVRSAIVRDIEALVAKEKK